MDWNLHADSLARSPGMGVFGNIENALGHLSVLAYPNDPFKMTFKNFDLVIIHGDRFHNCQNMTKANFLNFARRLQEVVF